MWTICGRKVVYVDDWAYAHVFNKKEILYLHDNQLKDMWIQQQLIKYDLNEKESE